MPFLINNNKSSVFSVVVLVFIFVCFVVSSSLYSLEFRQVRVFDGVTLLDVLFPLFFRP
jgi:hypothetical protein